MGSIVGEGPNVETRVGPGVRGGVLVAGRACRIGERASMKMEACAEVKVRSVPNRKVRMIKAEIMMARGRRGRVGSMNDISITETRFLKYRSSTLIIKFGHAFGRSA